MVLASPSLLIRRHIRDRTGAVVGVVNMTVDISERKQAEQMLAERNVQLALAGKFALVGTFTFDVDLERMQVSPGYVAIHDLPEGTEEISRDDWRSGSSPRGPALRGGSLQASHGRPAARALLRVSHRSFRR